MYSVEDFFKKKGMNTSSYNIKDENQYIENSLDEIKKIQEFDKMKSKVLKYALYKKRTEQEIRQKFSKELEENMLYDIIEVLKENSYIDDYNYIERTVNEYIKLKNLSIKEIKYKLYSKGIKNNLIEDYISENIDLLNEYEEKSVYNIIYKKQNNMEEDELKAYLLKKGYKEEKINKALHGGE